MGSNSVVGQGLTGLGNLLGVNHSNGTTQNDLFAQVKAPTALTPPKREDVEGGVIGDQVKDLQRRRASGTLFTGGQGVLDQPTTASTILLGS